MEGVGKSKLIGENKGELLWKIPELFFFRQASSLLQIVSGFGQKRSFMFLRPVSKDTTRISVKMDAKWLHEYPFAAKEEMDRIRAAIPEIGLLIKSCPPTQTETT